MEALIRHALSKLNPRNAGFPFEEMANKLINRSIHRQGELLHLPPTGPAGGGDGTSDGRIIRFNSGEHRICCSIDKDPKKKFQKDLKNLKAKGELTRLKAVLCITNKPIKEKDKLQFEKKVSADFKTTIYVLDESWLVLLLSNKDYYDLAIKYLECPDHLIQEQLVLYHYPYPAAPNFTGRSEEKKMLTNWFIKDKKNPILSIVEIGGMGKTALAWRWLQDNVIKKRLKLEGVVWWSFYDEKSSFEKFLDFCIENVIKTDPSARAITQDNVITLKNIKAKDIYDIIKINTDLFIKVTILDKIEMVYKYFQQAPFLLILDGIERMLKDYIGLGSPYKDEEVKDKENIDFNKCIDLNFGFFLRLLANETSKTKTLITTRIHPYELENLKGVKKMDLSPLKPEDAIKYFINMGLKGTRRELKEAATAYGYYPLCLNILAGMVLNDKKYPSDIRQWIKKNPFPKLKGEKQRHHILKLAYNSLNKNQQEMISKIATFRSSIKFEEITLLNKLDNDEVLQEMIGEFEKRRFLFQIHDKKGDVIKYDMHPIIKHFCYKQLKNPKKTHLMLHNYFKSISYSKVIKSLDDVQPLIEYYHHTVYAGKYSEAYKIYNEKLFSHIILQFGRHLIEIELLSALFPNGYNNPPKNLRDHQIHDALLNLGKSFSISGQLNYAMEIFKIINENNIAIIKNRFPKFKWRDIKSYPKVDITKKLLDKIRELIMGFGAIAVYGLLPLGNIESAIMYLKLQINISKKFKIPDIENIGKQEHGRILSYLGKYKESFKELENSYKWNIDNNNLQGQIKCGHYRAFSAFLMNNPKDALKYSINSLELAWEQAKKLGISQPSAREFINIRWLLGASHICLAKEIKNEEQKNHLAEAEKYLFEAITECRRINMVDFETSILLEIAKLRFIQNKKRKSEVFALEALEISLRSGNLFQEADIHYFLAEYYKNSNNKRKARKHAELAKLRSHQIIDKETGEYIIKKEKTKWKYKPCYDKTNILIKELEK